MISGVGDSSSPAPLLNRRPDVVLHTCVPADETLRSKNAVLVIEIVSNGSEKRDSVDKMTEYVGTAIPPN
jgi:Uma2 family endonuclease